MGAATIALMEINPEWLSESEVVAGKLIATLGVQARFETYANRRGVLENADFVVPAPDHR